MKKLLYTLFAFAIIVAGEKDAYDTDEVSVDSINAVVETVSKHDAAFQFINSVVENNITVKPIGKSNSPSTQRAGDHGTNWLQIIFFREGTNHAAYIRSDSQGEACANGLTDSSIAVYTLTSTELIIEIDGVATPYNVPVETYTAAFNQDGPDFLISVNSARTVAIAGNPPNLSDYNFSCAPTVAAPGRISVVGGINDFTLAHDYPAFDVTFTTSGGAADEYFIVTNGTSLTGTVSGSVLSIPAGQSSGRIRVRARNSAGETSNIITVVLTVSAAPSVDVSSFYTVSCAPFPLTGVLATINSGATLPNGATSANYAGTTEAAVRQAIERDILDNTEYVSTTALTNPCQ